MNKTQVMRELKALGTAQNRKIYTRHGVKGELFGVSYANLGKLEKKIGVDHGLTRELWATGNHDARVLATMIADPGEVSAKEVDAWVRDLDNYVVTDAFSHMVAGSPLARTRCVKWARSRKEHVAAAGWNLIGHLASTDTNLDDATLEGYLENIEAGIHGALNRARHSMNMALICIGARNPALRKKAIASARRIGKVEVDHGQTSCKTPDAVEYMEKMAAHQRAKTQRQRAKAQGAKPRTGGTKTQARGAKATSRARTR